MQRGEDRLLEMSEVDREAILYERAQARQAKAERRDLEKKIRELESQERGESRPSRSASASVQQKRQSLHQLKERRQRRHRNDSDSDYEEGAAAPRAGGPAKGSRRRARSQGSSSSYDDEDDDEDDEEDGEESYDDGSPARRGRTALRPGDDGSRPRGASEREAAASGGKARAGLPAQSAPLDFGQANRLRISRDTIAKLIFHPDFDEACRGCLMRLSIGLKDGVQVYRLVEVKRVVKYHRAYKIGATVTTDKAAILKYGRQERTFRFDIISNSDFTPFEYERWLATLKEEAQPIVTAKVAEGRAEQWRELETRPLSDSVVSVMIAAKRQLSGSHRNAVAERTMLRQQREEAIESGNAAEIERIEEELAGLTREQGAPASASEQRMASLSELNKRNRMINIVNAREAERKNVVGKRNGSDERHDPFSRRKCQPSNFHIVGSSTGAPRPVGEGGEALLPSAAVQDLAPEAEQGEAEAIIISTPIQPTLSAFSSYNVDIDIDI